MGAAIVKIAFLAAAVIATWMTIKKNGQPKVCPTCRRTVDAKATACPYCRRRVPLYSAGAGYWLAVCGAFALVLIMGLSMLASSLGFSI